MKRALAAIACIACGHAAGPLHAVVLARAPAHVPTTAERRADVCGRSDLAPLEGPLFAGSTVPVERGIVRSVSVLDASNRPVEVSAQIVSLVARDAPLDPAQTREVVRRLWMTGKFDDVAVETTRDGDGIALAFRVVAKREIANVFLTGDADVAALHVSAGALYDPVALVSARTGLVNELKKDGYLDATVVVSSAFAADKRALDVCVHVDQGPRVTLDKIVVHGTAYGPALESIVSASENVHGAILDEQVLERDLLLMSAALYDRGLLAHKVGKTVERHGNALTVTVDVTDGPVYRYSSLDVRGDLATAKADYMALVRPKRGDVFDRSAMLKVIEAIRALDKAKSHEQIEIEPETTLDEKTHTVAVVLALRDPGKVH